MSFSAREISTADGQPIRLYDFHRGLRHWCYTSADRSISYGGRTYLPAGISDDGIRQTGEASADTLVVSGSTDAMSSLVTRWRGVGPSSEVWLHIRDTHYGDDEAPVSWVGLVKDVSPEDAATTKITCTPLSASLDLPGLRLTWGRTCPYALGQRGCWVELDDFRCDVVIDTLDGATLTVPAAAAYGDDYFSAGFVEWPADDESGENETRGIERQLGATLTLLGGTEGLSQGQAVSIYPGCDLAIATCNDKFGNLLNCGAVKDLPEESPFDGNQAF
jgi:uncharacterized phage protein (TIGR02218 family)